MLTIPSSILSDNDKPKPTPEIGTTLSTSAIVQANSYYPSGALVTDVQTSFQLGSTSGDVQTHKFLGKELDRMYGLDRYDLGARRYDAAAVTFWSMDPLCEQYYHISPYAYCAGDPVNMIDPDGRQSIPYNKSRIIAQYGQIRVKTENLHYYTRNQILALNNDPRNWKVGEIGVSLEVAKLRFQTVPLPDPGTVSMDNTHGAATGDPTIHTVQNPTTKSSNNTQTDRRYSTRTVSGASNMTRVGARGILALDITIFGLQLAGGWSVYDDMKKVKQNLNALQGAINMVNSAAANGIIPEQYQNQTNMLDILNVVYQGENTTKDKNIMHIGIQILKANNIYDPKKIKPSEE